MRTLIVGFSVVLLLGCNSPTDTSKEEVEDLAEYDVTYRVQTFVDEIEIKSFVNDSLIADTIEGGQWHHEQTVKEGDSLSTTIRFLGYAYGSTEILFTHKQDTIGSNCHIGMGFSEGYTTDCHFIITEDSIPN